MAQITASGGKDHQDEPVLFQSIKIIRKNESVTELLKKMEATWHNEFMLPLLVMFDMF